MEVEVFGNVSNAISNCFKESSDLLNLVKSDIELQRALEDSCKLCIEAYKKNSKILIAGNGGSAADAQHFAGELVSRFNFDRPPLSALALSTDTSILTAIGNDYGFKEIFARQILANGRSGDVFFAISTSGNSENILQAIEVCRTLDIKVVGLTGISGGKMKDMCDLCMMIPSTSVPRIQECHLIIEHIICAVIEDSLFGKQFN
jgi:D-sedoheptulose 7-phosphate isomerase